jgi:hypothetical protein
VSERQDSSGHGRATILAQPVTIQWDPNTMGLKTCDWVCFLAFHSDMEFVCLVMGFIQAKGVLEGEESQCRHLGIFYTQYFLSLEISSSTPQSK